MNLTDKIKLLINECGLDYVEKDRTIYTTCPLCLRNDKCSILKENGATICYHASCEFGRRWFEDWLALTLKITKTEAKHKLYNLFYNTNDPLDIELENPDIPPLKEINYPFAGLVSLDNSEAIPAQEYLIKRGFIVNNLIKYKIMYEPLTRRIFIPAIMNNRCYGWQARSIDNVPPSDRIRNNTGFRRAMILLFYDTLKNKDFVILTEGPFDALKFEKIGSFVASMGAILTKEQINLLHKSKIKTVYLAYDPDILSNVQYIEKLIKSIGLHIKILQIPKTCLDRCKKLNKKPDFGECTYEEAESAFYSAKSFDIMNYFIDYLSL